MPLAPITTWRIHIGAHKTATTHVQETLAAMRAGLVARGVDFIPNSGCCAGRLRRGARAPAAWNRLPPLRGPMVRRMVARHLDPLRAGPATLVLSEEKLLGGSQHVFAEPIYPQVQRIIALLATLGGRADVTLFLSIRSFDTQLPSAYVQELQLHAADRRRVRHHQAPGARAAAELVRAGAADPRRRPGGPAPGLAAGGLPRHTAAILAGSDGLDDARAAAGDRGPGLDPLAGASRRSGPPRRCRRCPSAERRERVAGDLRRDAGEGPRFRPFTRAERALLQAAYADDIERIAALDPSILLRF